MNFGSDDTQDGFDSAPLEGELWMYRGNQKELRWPTRPGFCAVTSIFDGDTLTVISSGLTNDYGFDEMRCVFLVRGPHGWRLTGRVAWSLIFKRDMERIEL